MIKPSASLLFPFAYDNENDCLKRATTVEDMLLSAIRIFLLTRQGSRPGTNVGSFLPELLMQAIPVSSLPSLADSLKAELITNFPGVNFITVTMTRDLSEFVSDIILKIQFSSGAQENITDFSMPLPTIFDKSQNIQTAL